MAMVKVRLGHLEVAIVILTTGHVKRAEETEQERAKLVFVASALHLKSIKIRKHTKDKEDMGLWKSK